MYYGIDTYYLILVIPAMIFSMWAQAKVNSTFKRYSQQRTYSGMTGYEAARRILQQTDFITFRWNVWQAILPTTMTQKQM